jgi:hypothetical protein
MSRRHAATNDKPQIKRLNDKLRQSGSAGQTQRSGTLGLGSAIRGAYTPADNTVEGNV